MKKMFRLEDKIAIVTGAGSGLGKMIAAGYSTVGATVVVADIDGDAAEKVASSLNGNVIPVTVDVSDATQVDQLMATVIARFGRVDIMVNNAGIGIPKRAGKPIPLKDLDMENWNKVLAVNLTGVFLGCQKAGNLMIAQGEGRIINIASISGMIVNRGLLGIGVYCVAKSGVIMLTKALAEEWGKYNVHVNAISPGYMKTPQNKKMRDNAELSQRHLADIPFGRYGEPEDVIGAAIFLAADASRYLTGSNIVVDGGYSVA